MFLRAPAEVPEIEIAANWLPGGLPELYPHASQAAREYHRSEATSLPARASGPPPTLWTPLALSRVPWSVFLFVVLPTTPSRTQA